jgi:dienelactone hydrolase
VRQHPGRRHRLTAVLVCAFILVGSLALAATAQSPAPDASPGATLDPCVEVGTSSPAPPSALPMLTAGLSPVTPKSAAASPSAAAASSIPSLTPLLDDTSDCTADMVVPAASPAVSAATPLTRTAASKSRKPGRIRERENVPFMKRQPCAEFRSGCINRTDIYYPSSPGPWPVIVTIHGRPRTPQDMEELAETLAAKGAVVFNIDYRGVRPVSKGFPEAISDVACAIRYARQNARHYGGDRDHVILVGHSMGGYVGAMVALAGDTFPAAAGSCKSSLGMKASLPDGFVSVAGVSVIHPSYHIDQVFLGGTYQQIPGVWRRATLYTHIGRHVGRNHRLKVGIIFERHDPYLGTGHATYLHAALRQAGYDSDLVLLDEGTTHFDILDTDQRIGRRVVMLVWHIVHETDPD